jgi:hypothetical protein
VAFVQLWEGGRARGEEGTAAHSSNKRVSQQVDRVEWKGAASTVHEARIPLPVDHLPKLLLGRTLRCQGLAMAEARRPATTRARRARRALIMM